MNSKILSVCFLIVGLVGGYLYGSFSVKSEYEGIFEKVKSVLPVLPEEIKSLSGSVQEVGDDYLVIKTPSSGNPLEEWPEVRKILVNQDTSMYKITPKTKEAMDRDMLAFQKESAILISAGKNLPPPPTPFEEKLIKLEDIKNGEIVLVESLVNIKLASEFEASSIRINSSANSVDKTPPPTVPINN